MNNTEPKTHQHYVPRMYLKRWVHDSEKNNMLYVISPKLGDFEVHEKSYDDELFYINFCYDVVSEDGELFTKNEVENHLDEYEKRHDRLLNRIIERCDKGQDVLDKGTNRFEDFMEFVGLLTVRNPNNDIPLPTSSDSKINSAQEMADLLNYLTSDVFKLTSTKVISIANNKNMLFQMADQFKKFHDISFEHVYFLEAPDGCAFITSDNPVITTKKVFYLPISPKYLAYILYDDECKPSFSPNKPYVISKECVDRFNRSYLRNDVFTLVGNNNTELADILNKSRWQNE